MQVKPVPTNDKEISIHIKLAKNGVVVDGTCYEEDGPSESETYVYQTVDEALKEVPALISVLEQGVSKKKPDLAKAEAKANQTVSGK